MPSPTEPSRRLRLEIMIPKRMPKKLANQRRYELNKKNFPSEAWFEKQLIKNNIGRYLRNMPIDKRYFGDFVWRRDKIVVEIDGSSHNGKEAYDKARDGFMEKLGYKVFRIKYKDTKRMNEVIAFLAKTIQVIKPSHIFSSDNNPVINKTISQKRKQRKENNRLVKEKFTLQRQETHKIHLVKKTLMKTLKLARSFGGEKGNTLLALKLKELNLTPEQAKAYLA